MFSIFTVIILVFTLVCIALLVIYYLLWSMNNIIDILDDSEYITTIEKDENNKTTNK